ncbi:MAG TPA: MFS transporter [Chloroflexota bacterium]|nr:MFS transporter [Chloroflexota bacterium]
MNQPDSRSSEELPRWRKLVATAAIDAGPLRRHRDFRLLFAGRAVSFFGTMITAVAVPYQVFRITGSSFAVGLLGLCEIVPILGLAFVGGALADAHDRRRMVLVTELAMSGVSAVLVFNALLPQPQLGVLYAAAAVLAGLDALQTPSLDALLPRLVGRNELTAAGALSELRTTAGMIAGPALGGVLIASIGLPATYLVDVGTFGVGLGMLLLMRAVPPPAGAERPSVRRILEGLRYARSRPELLGTYLVDMNAMFFGMPNALFPAVAARYGGAKILGLLLAAPAVGSFVAVATSGWSNHVRRHGLAVILAAGAWGVAIVGFGLSPNLPLILLCLALAGGADMISGIFRSVIWNQTIPDSLRGRLAGIEMISYSSGPTLGNVEAGAVASAFSLRSSIISGGVLCVLGTAILAFTLPGFRRYDARAG